MPTPNTIDVCRAHLFTKEVELREQYPQAVVDKVLRVREMYNWFIANPDGTDREFVAEVCQRHGIHRTTAYSDLAVVKSLSPCSAAQAATSTVGAPTKCSSPLTKWPSYRHAAFVA